MRRLPIFFVLDCSDSMAGLRIQQMEAVLQAVIRQLRTDPQALEQVFVSVIAFAGVARTIVPLIELTAFYPPKLPLGSGTHLGAALDVLQQEINRQVQRGTAERKGDWKPVVYLLTDGRPTDAFDAALARWRGFVGQVQLVTVGLGDDPDYALLEQLGGQTLRFHGSSEEDFTRLIRWISQSVQARSQSVGLDAPRGEPAPAQGGLSLVKSDPAPPAAPPLRDHEDPQCVTLTGRCSRNRRPYLMRYERMRRSDLPDVLHKYQPARTYQLDGAYRLEEDYFLWSDPLGQGGAQVNASDLLGTPPCPQCGNACAFALCGCGGLMCINGPDQVTCPWCERDVQFAAGGGDDDFAVVRSQG